MRWKFWKRREPPAAVYYYAIDGRLVGADREGLRDIDPGAPFWRSTMLALHTVRAQLLREAERNNDEERLARAAGVHEAIEFLERCRTQGAEAYEAGAGMKPPRAGDRPKVPERSPQ